MAFDLSKFAETLKKIKLDAPPATAPPRNSQPIKLPGLGGIFPTADAAPLPETAPPRQAGADALTPRPLIPVPAAPAATGAMQAIKDISLSLNQPARTGLPAPDDIAAGVNSGLIPTNYDAKDGATMPPITSNGYPSALPQIETNQRNLTPPTLNPQLNPADWQNAVKNLSLDAPPVKNWWTENAKKADEIGESAVPAPIALPSSLRPSEQTAGEAARIEGKKYGFKKDENGKVIIGENGKPVYEKDRDSDHNWWDIIKSIGLGFAQGGLSGAIGGGIGGALDRNFDEKMIDGIKLNRLNNQFESQTKREQSQQGYDLREVQKQNILTDNETAKGSLALRQKTGERNSLLGQVRTMKRYKRGENSEFDAKLEAANIEQPDFEPAKKINPTYYDGDGRKMTYDANGRTVPVLTPDGQEVVDDSRANVYVNGYAAKGRDALAATTAADVKNNQYGNSDEEDRVKYQNEKQEVEAFNRGVDAEIQSKRDIAKNLELANEQLQAQRAQLATNPILNSEQIKQIDQQIATNTGQWRTANGEVSALGGKKKTIPIPPKPRRQVSTPQISNTGKPVAPNKDPMGLFQ